ncbi:MAG: transcriptional regulator, partial [Eubacteriales bacterium]|nr:transcriptional regulator [Eubacteriales bacterium]
MKHYEKLVELGCFSRQTMVEMLGSDATAASMIRAYLEKGYIERVRHDLYAVISIETKQPIFSRYQIGASLFPDACITHHSAFEVFGYANQVFYETYVSTNSRFVDFEYHGVAYHRLAPKENAAVIRQGNVAVTDLEQTVVDGICDFEKVGGLEETMRCILLIPSLNGAKI